MLRVITVITALFAFGLLQTSAFASPLIHKNSTYTTIANPASPFIKVASREPYLLIISVKCNSTTLGSDTDSIYFSMSNGLKHPLASESPFKIRKGQVWEPHFFVSASKAIDITLMESDLLGGDDAIGTFRFNPSKGIGRFSEKMDGDFSKYEIIFEIRE